MAGYGSASPGNGGLNGRTGPNAAKRNDSLSGAIETTAFGDMCAMLHMRVVKLQLAHGVVAYTTDENADKRAREHSMSRRQARKAYRAGLLFGQYPSNPADGSCVSGHRRPARPERRAARSKRSASAGQ